jgi:hypothetical protein
MMMSHAAFFAAIAFRLLERDILVPLYMLEPISKMPYDTFHGSF